MVPLLLLIPVLSHSDGSPAPMLLELVLKGGAILLLVVFGAKWAVPRLLYGIVKTRNRELFLVSIVVLCFGVAWLTSAAGLSLALGAFLAGIIISESEYSHEALANVLPFRDLFSGFFFINIGMLLNIQFVADNLAFVGSASLGVIVLKALVVCAVGLLIGYPLRIAVIIGLALAQVGEFSFVLAKAGLDAELLNMQSYQLFLAVSVVSMVVSPFAIAAAPAAAHRLMRIPFISSLQYDDAAFEEGEAFPKDRLSNHILIIGYGPAGKHVAQAALTWDIPYVIIEMNPVTVRQVGKEGMPIVFGDATHAAVLEKTNIHEARMAVIVISDPPAVRQVTKVCRELNPELYIIGRTRFLQEIQVLQQIGANAVVSEEMEASIEILSRLLSHYYIPSHEVEAFIRELRAQGYTALRDEMESIRAACDIELPNVDVERIQVKEGAPGADRTILELGLRKNYGVTLLAVRRNGRIISNPGPDTLLLPGDVVLAVGKTKDLARVSTLLHVSFASGKAD
jgi:CPA2 family monovalent cation:H+ antiporter-2